MPKIIPVQAQEASPQPYGRGVQYPITLHVDLCNKEGERLVNKLEDLLTRNPASAFVFCDKVNTALVVCCTVHSPEEQATIERLLRGSLQAWLLWLQGQDITTWLSTVVELVSKRPLIAIEPPSFTESA